MLYSALLGNPVDHSISPVLFKIFSEKTNIEYSHIKIKVPSANKLGLTLKSLMNLGFCGVNITLPYKIIIIKHIDKLSYETKKIGAVNTIVFKENKMIGYNTDSKGALLAIEKRLKPVSINDKILIIGAGGAARAIIFELFKKNKNITILNRDLLEASKVSQDFSNKKNKLNIAELNDENLTRYLRKCNLIINATPVGMYPRSNEDIISRKIFNNCQTLKGKYFFDVIFNPYKTNFLRKAEKKGAKICSGTYMMIYQAIYAFKLWTGVGLKKINIEEVNKKLIKALSFHKNR